MATISQSLLPWLRTARCCLDIALFHLGIPIELRHFIQNYLHTSIDNRIIRKAILLWCDTSPHIAEMMYGPISYWDTSQVADMSQLFYSAQRFNEDISRWDVSNVIYMDGLFDFAKSFNQPLNTWDVSKVQSMKNMFFRAEKFNQPLDKWNVSACRI